MKLNKYILQWEEHQVCLKRVAILAPSKKWIHDNFSGLEELYRLESELGDWTSYEKITIEHGCDDEEYDNATDYEEEEA